MDDLRDERLPLPQELVGDLSGSVRDAIGDYLSKGWLFARYRCFSWCRFLCGVGHEEMGTDELSDGEWVWPVDLVHYVRVHNVVLPDEFVASVMANNVKAKQRDGEDASLDFWIEWAGKRRSPQIRQRLAGALAAARSAEPACIDSFIKSRVDEVLRKESEGEDACLWEGCSNRALVKRKICARHTLNDTDIQSHASSLYRLSRQVLMDVSLL